MKARAGGLAADAAQAQAELGGGAVVLEAVALGEGLGEELGAVAEGVVEPARGTRAGSSMSRQVVVLADGQADGRTASGPWSTSGRDGFTQRWIMALFFPSSSVRPFTDRPTPNSVTIREMGLLPLVTSS